MASSTGKLLNDLRLSILLRFRQHKYIVSSNVIKMYLAVKLNPSQRCNYSLNTVTYGTASAPYLATKSLVTLADTTSDERVKQSIQNYFYVDDYLSDGDSIIEVVQLAHKEISILSSAKFFLRKWKSNSKLVLSEIPGVSEESHTLNFAEGQNHNSRPPIDLSTRYVRLFILINCADTMNNLNDNNIL